MNSGKLECPPSCKKTLRSSNHLPFLSFQTTLIQLYWMEPSCFGIDQNENPKEKNRLKGNEQTRDVATSSNLHKSMMKQLNESST